MVDNFSRSAPTSNPVGAPSVHITKRSAAKASNDRISLHPLQPADALRALLQTSKPEDH